MHSQIYNDVILGHRQILCEVRQSGVIHGHQGGEGKEVRSKDILGLIMCVFYIINRRNLFSKLYGYFFKKHTCRTINVVLIAYKMFNKY